MYDDVKGQLDGAADQLLAIGAGLLELGVAVVLASLVARWLRRRLRPRIDELRSASAAVLIQNLLTGGVYVVFLTVLLALWGMTWSSLVTALSISTVAVAFGFQDLLRSIVGGALIVFEKPFAPGDRIKIRDIEGRVEQVQIRTTTVITDGADRVILPNALVFSDPVINRSPDRRRMSLTVNGIDGEPADVKMRALQAMATVPDIVRVEVSVRARKPHMKVRRAIEAVPRLDRQPSPERSGARAVGLTVRWLGDGGRGQLERATTALRAAFPDARIGSGGWT